MKKIKETKSICPECKQEIPATIFEEDNKVFIKKTCTKHGEFRDLYNFDLERVQRCVIHYATPDGTIIPFCTMNNLHRENIDRKYARPLSVDKMTPLYDVQSLVSKIRLEDEFTEHSQHLDEHNHVLIPENQ